MEIGQIPSVFDHDAFATECVPDLGYDVKELQVFHWKLLGWKKLEKKLTSSEFDCGGHKWRILLFPLGNSYPPLNDVVSVYLDHTGPEGMEKDWHVCAQFALVISNPHDPTIHTVNHAHHRFTIKEPDWGFTRFSELSKLFQSQPGCNRPMIEGDSTVISVYVRVFELEDPTGALWHNLVNYDSRKQTGYVGLKTQGATAYMNAELQFLFHIHYFRKAIYQIPTGDHRPAESVLLALQRVFYNLQTSDKPVDTTELTKSLNWSPVDPFGAHSVQEFNRGFQQRLETLMRGTCAEDAIQKLFRGKMRYFIKCVNVNYEEFRMEEFDDIQLKVKGMKTLRDSFRDYVAVETLDGESKYRAAGFGLQDARRGIAFRSFPSVLRLHLKRHEYDTQLGTMLKINDRFEFPFEIDLDEFLDGTTDKSEPWKYELYSVFVRSGDLHHGHNYVFIKPDRRTQWLKFCNDRVTPVTDREVLEENYGGELLEGIAPQVQGNCDGAIEMSTNAYVLAYIRRAAIGELMVPLTEEDTLHLRELDEERAQVEAKGREEQCSLMTIKVITDETFSHHEGFDLAVFDDGNWPLSNLPAFHALKQETYSMFKSRVAQCFGYPKNQIRLWVVCRRQNKTVRPDMYIPENEPSLTVKAILDDIAVRQQSDLWLYLDILPDTSEEGDARMIMIFLKHFDFTKQSLLGIGKIYMPSASKVRDLIPIINKRMKWAPGTSLRLYEEIHPGMIELMRPRFTLARGEIQDGDIVCFQVNISGQEAHKLESQGLYSSAKQFYAMLKNRMVE